MGADVQTTQLSNDLSVETGTGAALWQHLAERKHAKELLRKNPELRRTVTALLDSSDISSAVKEQLEHLLDDTYSQESHVADLFSHYADPADESVRRVPSVPEKSLAQATEQAHSARSAMPASTPSVAAKDTSSKAVPKRNPKDVALTARLRRWLVQNPRTLPIAGAVAGYIGTSGEDVNPWWRAAGVAGGAAAGCVGTEMLKGSRSLQDIWNGLRDRWSKSTGAKPPQE